MDVHVMKLLLFLVMMSMSCGADEVCDRVRCVPQAKVAHFTTTSALSSGACGYGSLALGFNNGYLAAAAPSIYKDALGCGACYQIRCKNPSLCTKKGTTVVVTDLTQNNQTHFVLSKDAFTSMALKGKASPLTILGLVQVEYKRVPCNYGNKNLSMRVEDYSQKPHYLAIKFLYQGGQTQIIALEVASVNSSSSSGWNTMSRNYGAVWDTSKVPNGALQFRFAVMGGYDANWFTVKALPADWKNGMIYDSGVKITQIAQDGCSPCHDDSWN